VADVVERLDLGSRSNVVELASNDGYLLQWFVQRNIPVLGIDPAGNVAPLAEARGVPTRVDFFGVDVAQDVRRDRGPADLIVANNVLAHVDDLHDFVGGIGALLAPDGRASIEFPHLLRLIEELQFDTIYHEHFSYLSLAVVSRIFGAHGLKVFDVQQQPTHGGSLRVLASRDDDARKVERNVAAVLEAEEAAGLASTDGYARYTERVQRTKWALLDLLIGLRRQGKRVVGYGAPAKGNTLLNYCGVRTDLIEYTVDRNNLKQGKLLPGTRIPIRAPEAVFRDRPDYVLILPWNLQEEIATQMAEIRSWGGRFIVPIPEPRIVG
jgi:SAM-dependent methyltransferase